MEYVATENAPAAIGPYSQAIEHGGLVYVSGQLGMQPADGEMVEGFEAQTRQALENMKAILEASGSSMEKVISVDVFMTDLGKFLDFNAIYAEYFSTHKPARAAIEVCALPKGGLVEMKCIAAK